MSITTHPFPAPSSSSSSSSSTAAVEGEFEHLIPIADDGKHARAPSESWVRKGINIGMAGVNLAIASVASWSMREGIIIIVTDVLGTLEDTVGIGPGSMSTPTDQMLVRAGNFILATHVTEGLLGYMNYLSSAISGAIGTSINNCYGKNLVEGPTNVGARKVYDNVVVMANFAQQSARGVEFIQMGGATAHATSTWVNSGIQAAGAAGALAGFIGGATYMIYLEFRDRESGGLRFPALKETKSSENWEKFQNKLRPEYGGRIEASMTQEFTGDPVTGLAPVSVVQGVQSFAIAYMRSQGIDSVGTEMVGGVLYGLSSSLRAYGRAEDRRHYEVTNEKYQDLVASSGPPGSMAYGDMSNEHADAMEAIGRAIRREPNLKELVLVHTVPAMTAVVTHLVVDHVFDGLSNGDGSRALAGSVTGVLVGVLTLGALRYCSEEPYGPQKLEHDTPDTKRPVSGSTQYALSLGTTTAVATGVVTGLIGAGLPGAVTAGVVGGVAPILVKKMTKDTKVMQVPQVPQRGGFPEFATKSKLHGNLLRSKEAIFELFQAVQGKPYLGPTQARPVQGPGSSEGQGIQMAPPMRREFSTPVKAPDVSIGGPPDKKAGPHWLIQVQTPVEGKSQGPVIPPELQDGGGEPCRLEQLMEGGLMRIGSGPDSFAGKYQRTEVLEKSSYLVMSLSDPSQQESLIRAIPGSRAWAGSVPNMVGVPQDYFSQH